MSTNESDLSQTLKRIHDAGQDFLNGKTIARPDLLAALAQAQREVEGPALYLTRSRLLPLNNMCQLLAIETGLLKAIVEKNGVEVTAETLSLEIKQSQSLINRIMRVLLVHGICQQVAPATYRSNPVADALNSREQQGAVRNMVGLLFPIAGRLVDQLREPVGLSEFPDTATSVTPFRATYGHQSLFDFLKSNPEWKRAFDDFQAARIQGDRRPWFDFYPVQDRILQGVDDGLDSALIVDVAGGLGGDITGFKQRFAAPGRHILEDLPGTLENINPAPSGIELCAHDIFTPQPIKGARLYFLRAILHDWSDERCHTILLEIAKAMRKGYSRLLIEDIVLADMNEGFRGASLDMLMFFLVEGKERTRSEFETLLGGAGLKLVRVWAGNPGGESIVEAELA